MFSGNKDWWTRVNISVQIWKCFARKALRQKCKSGSKLLTGSSLAWLVHFFLFFLADSGLADLTCTYFLFHFCWLVRRFGKSTTPVNCDAWREVWDILLWICVYVNRSIKTYFHFLQMVIRVVQFRHWTGSRVQKCDPFEQVLWKMKSWRIQLAKVRLRTETEVASLQTSDCTRLCADLKRKFNFNFSRLKICVVMASVWYMQQFTMP